LLKHSNFNFINVKGGFRKKTKINKYVMPICYD